MAVNNPIVEKLRKVLALTTSSNEHESALALTTLQRLLTEHNLSMADLEQRGHAAAHIEEQGHDLGKAAFKWKLRLAEAVASHFFCFGLVDHRSKTIKFIGRPDNVESLQLLYPWIIKQVADLAREERRNHFVRTNEHVDPLRWQVNFGEGAVDRLQARLEELARSRATDVQALVVHHESEISDFLEETYGFRRDGQKTRAQREREEQSRRYMESCREQREIKEARKRLLQESGDLDTLYREFPELHPEEVARREQEEARCKAENDKWYQDQERKRRQRERRREQSGYYERSQRYRPLSAEERRKQNQAHAAHQTGHRTADRVNLQPFLAPSETKGEIK